MGAPIGDGSSSSSPRDARPRALVLQHDADAGAGVIYSWLTDRGIDADVVRVPDHASAPDPSPYALVVSLGSTACVNDALSWARGEESLLRQAHAAGTPVLGVCFGAQLLARALGGQVQRAAVREIGWQTIRSSRPRLVAPGPWLQWHFDSMHPPTGAEVIAASKAGVEAFRWGNSLGLQFHPEVTPPIVAEWVRVYRSELDACGVSPEEILATTAANAASARVRAYDLFDAFALRAGLASARGDANGLGGATRS